MYQPSKQLFSFHVSGFQYWDGALAIGGMKIGDQIELRPEFDNPHDANAIALYSGSFKLGYVPACMNETLATMLFYGHSDVFEVRVLQVNLDADPWKQLRVGIFITDARDESAA